MNIQVRIKTDLTTEPVTRAEAKNFCRVTGTQDDTLIDLLITAARKALEKYTGCSFGEKTIYATWVERPEDNILEMPYGPIISVDKVYLIDEEGTEEEQTLNSDYYVTGDQDASISIAQMWSSGVKVNSAVRVEYTAGYGDTNTEPLPDELKLAIMKQVATDYSFRENMTDISVSILNNESKKLAAPYRKVLWF
jgi:uncharacterized phiE125 gp8 family phage protein